MQNQKSLDMWMMSPSGDLTSSRLSSQKMKHAWSHSCIFSAPGTCLLSHPFIDLNVGQGDSQKGSSSLLLVCPSVKYMWSRDKVTWGGTKLLWSKRESTTKIGE